MVIVSYVLRACSGEAGDGDGAPDGMPPTGTTGNNDGDFAWTIKAKDVLVRLRFGSMRDRFQGTRNAAQLKRSWFLLASETSRLVGLMLTQVGAILMCINAVR